MLEFGKAIISKEDSHTKNTKIWYTIDALSAIFTIFTILSQYFYNTYISKYLIISQNIVDTIDIVGNADIVDTVDIVDC